jgi:elongation factor G
MDTRGTTAILRAEVPLSEMFGYSTAIRTLSSGRASYSMQPARFEQVPQQIVEQIVEQRGTKN